MCACLEEGRWTRGGQEAGSTGLVIHGGLEPYQGLGWSGRWVGCTHGPAGLPADALAQAGGAEPAAPQAPAPLHGGHGAWP